MDGTDGTPDPRHAALLRHLAEFDEACPSSRYSLRGLKGDRCPECNQGLVLRVGLAEPRMGALLAALFPLLGGSGMATVFLGIAVAMSLRHNPPPESLWALVFGVPLLAAGVLGSAAWLLSRARGRGWFRGLGGRERTVVVVTAWAGLAGFVTVFLVLLERL